MPLVAGISVTAFLLRSTSARDGCDGSGGGGVGGNCGNGGDGEDGPRVESPC